MSDERRGSDERPAEIPEIPVAGAEAEAVPPVRPELLGHAHRVRSRRRGGADHRDRRHASSSSDEKATEASTPTAPTTAAVPAPPATWPPAEEEFAWQSFLAGAPEHGREVDRRCFLNVLESRWPSVVAYSNAPQADRDAVVLELLTRCT
jgi:hypothetical protein